MKRFLFTLALSLLSIADLAANPVVVWNEEALNATRLSRYPPPLAAAHYATFHLAIFDAVNGITRTHRPWLVDESAPEGALIEAAIAGAAHTVLQALWAGVANPRNLQAAYEREIAGLEEGPGKEAGLAWGKSVAQRILEARADSGTDRPETGSYSSNEPGRWRETPFAFRPPVLPEWGRVRPFAIPSPEAFRAPEPPAEDSAQYAEEIAFVARVGARDGAERTEYQTLSTPFWSDDLGTATPPGHWNSVAQDLARDRKLTVPESARLFALLNLAMADTGITCWESKYHYRTWRPENALRETSPEFNPDLVVVPDFIPNMASPAFPAYPSGHSAFSAAGTRLLERFFGTDQIEFTAISDGLPGVVRTYRSLSEAREEVGMSRVWGGIHIMSDNLEGQKMGMAIADYVFENSLPGRASGE